MSDKTKEERIVDYVTSIAALDDAMKPYKEQKGDLRKSYLDKDRKSTRLNSSHVKRSRMPSSA